MIGSHARRALVAVSCAAVAMLGTVTPASADSAVDNSETLGVRSPCGYFRASESKEPYYNHCGPASRGWIRVRYTIPREDKCVPQGVTWLNKDGGATLVTDAYWLRDDAGCTLTRD